MKIPSFGRTGKLCPYLLLTCPLFRPCTMPWRRIALPVFLLLSGFMVAWGQPDGGGTPPPEGTRVIRPLSLGDTMPKITLGNVYGAKNNTLSLGSQNDQLVILDFFHTTCGSCINKIALLDSLRAAFSGKLEVVMVTKEPFSYLQTWWPKSRYARNFSFPVVTADTLLRRLFPHEIISHFVWIDHKGIVKAITGPEALTRENISAAIESEWPAMALKKDFLDFNPDDPLFLPASYQNRQVGGAPIFYSGFLEPIDGVIGVWTTKKEDKTGKTTTRIINCNLSKLICIANNTNLWLQPSFICVSNKLQRLQPDMQQRLWGEVYCYEATLPHGTDLPEVRKVLKNDIEKFLGLSTHLMEEEVPCLELIIKDPAKLAAAAKPLAIPETDSIHFTKIKTCKNLAAYLNKMPGELPVVCNEQAMEQLNIWISNNDLENREAATKMLTGIGLGLAPVRRKLTMLLID